MAPPSAGIIRGMNLSSHPVCHPDGRVAPLGELLTHRRTHLLFLRHLA